MKTLLSLSVVTLFSLSTFGQDAVVVGGGGVKKNPKARAAFQKIIVGTWLGECAEFENGAVRADIVFSAPEADKLEQKSQIVINVFSDASCKILSKAEEAQLVELKAEFDDEVTPSPKGNAYAGTINLSSTDK